MDSHELLEYLKANLSVHTDVEHNYGGATLTVSLFLGDEKIDSDFVRVNELED